MLKTCNKCGQEKDVTEFSPTSPYKGKAHYRCDCKECNAKSAREWYHKDPAHHQEVAKRWKLRNPEKVTNTRRLYAYGLTPEGYAAFLKAQNGNCAICEGSLEKPYVDHCHTTGKVRGILCLTCNTGLGKFQDSVKQLQKAIQYLQKSSE